MLTQFDFDKLTAERDAALQRATDAEAKNTKLVGHIEGFDSIEAKADGCGLTSLAA